MSIEYVPLTLLEKHVFHIVSQERIIMAWVSDVNIDKDGKNISYTLNQTDSGESCITSLVREPYRPGESLLIKCDGDLQYIGEF